MKQSSIEWLLCEQRKVYSKFAKGEFSVSEYEKEIEKINNQAKEMHKKDIVVSFHQGMIKRALMELNDEISKTFEDLDKIEPFKEGTEYYKNTYENETK